MAGSRSPTASSSCPSGPSAWPRSSSSRCWPTRPCTARTSPRRPTSPSSRARARSSRTSSGRGSARSSGSSARSRWCSSRWASSTTSRACVADVLKTLHLRDNERWSESKIYATIVWTMVLLGCAVLLSGFDQPLVLLVLSACLNGIVMFIYSILLIKLNRTGPAAGDPGLRLPARHARLRGPVLRVLRRLVRDRPARGDLLACSRRLFARFVVFAATFAVLYVAAGLLGSPDRLARPWTIGRVDRRPIQGNYVRTRTQPHGGGELFGSSNRRIKIALLGPVLALGLAAPRRAAPRST